MNRGLILIYTFWAPCYTFRFKTGRKKKTRKKFLFVLLMSLKIMQLFQFIFVQIIITFCFCSLYFLTYSTQSQRKELGQSIEEFMKQSCYLLIYMAIHPIILFNFCSSSPSLFINKKVYIYETKRANTTFCSNSN